MVSFEQLNLHDGSPIYLQIIRHVKQGIVAGTIQNGDELPSRRFLSALLGVNPNTVQKSYRMLEEELLIESRSGAKSYVVLDDKKVGQIRQQLLVTDAQTIVNALKKTGISREEALALIDQLWQSEVEI